MNINQSNPQSNPVNPVVEEIKTKILGLNLGDVQTLVTTLSEHFGFDPNVLSVQQGAPAAGGQVQQTQAAPAEPAVVIATVGNAIQLLKALKDLAGKGCFTEISDSVSLIDLKGMTGPDKLPVTIKVHADRLAEVEAAIKDHATLKK